MKCVVNKIYFIYTKVLKNVFQSSTLHKVEKCISHNEMWIATWNIRGQFNALSCLIMQYLYLYMHFELSNKDRALWGLYSRHYTLTTFYGFQGWL